MPLPKIIPGGEDSLWQDGGYDAALDRYHENINDLHQYPPRDNALGSRGQFAQYPGSTPKYALNDGPRDAEYRETMARMFIEMPSQERDPFVKSLPEETRPLGQILCGAGPGAAGGTGFMDFLLTDVTEPFQEKFQIVESLSDNFIVYVFGQKAPIFQYSGVLYNTYQDDQRVWMTRIYRDIARGTQLARRKKLIRLRYDSVIVSGIMIAMQQSIKGDAVNWAQFSFSLIPMQYVIFTPSGGVPTKLKDGFTEGSAYGLRSTAVPSTDKLRSAAATHPSRQSAKPAAVQETSNAVKAYEEYQAVPQRPQSVLSDRTIEEKTVGPTIEKSKNVRGNIPPPLSRSMQ